MTSRAPSGAPAGPEGLGERKERAAPRERFWVVTFVDRPVDGENYLTASEVRRALHVNEAGLLINSIRLRRKKK